MNKKNLIQRVRLTTHEGNVLELFYNAENGLVVLDLIALNGEGGIELLRKKLDESDLLKHTRGTK